MSLLRNALIGCAALCAAMVLPRRAVAQSSDAKDAKDDDARYDAASAALRDADAGTSRWWTAWTITFGTLTAAQGTAAFVLPDDGLRIDSAVGAAKSGLGFLAMLVTPRSAMGAASELGAMDAGSDAARHRRRERADQLLRACADEEALERSWLPHVASAVTNLTGAVVLWAGYQRYASGWLSLATGTAVSELQIWTRPTAASRALRGETDMANAAHAAPPRFTWTLGVQPGGLVVSGAF